MKFKHCLLLSVFFASLLIIALIKVSKPMASEKIAVASENPNHGMTILQARHIPKDSVKFRHPL